MRGFSISFIVSAHTEHEQTFQYSQGSFLFAGVRFNKFAADIETVTRKKNVRDFKIYLPNLQNYKSVTAKDVINIS